MARGGARNGTPGKAYANRRDLSTHQPITVAPGGQYGSGVASEEAQKILPLPSVTAPSAAPTPQLPPVAAGGSGGVVAPGDINFEGPTQRPDEPVTAGLPVGPGPGPEALNPPLPQVTPNDPAVVLRAMYQNVPEAQNNDVLRLIEALDKRPQ